MDGLRAVAVLAVVLFHGDVGWASGGYLGVDLFFVISGFLITGLLAREFDRSGRIALDGFYLRRARRLLPAYVLMTVATILVAGLVAQDALPRLRWDALASLVYVTNWELIYAGKSYFEEMGRQPLLLHLWSLAIEEQFYIVWAPVVLLCLPRLGRRGLAAVALSLAALSVFWMAHKARAMGYPELGDPSRLYFGTDTHGFALLIGAALALVWSPERLKPVLSLPANEAVFMAGAAALAAIIALFVYLDEVNRYLYPWGFLIAAIASAALIVAATHPGGYFGRWLDSRPMRWLGERSYGIYLWHWPIFMMTRPDIDLHLPANEVFVFRVGLTLGIAALSYRYVEQPIRNGAIGRFVKALRNRPRHSSWRGAVAVVGSIVASITAVSVLTLAPSAAHPAADVAAALNLDSKNGQPNARTLAMLSLPPLPVAQKAVDAIYTGDQVTAVGDSVLLGSSWLFTHTFKGAKVYATVGWQAQDVLNQLKTLRDSDTLGDVVLVHLGTNGYIYEEQLRRILTLLADRKRVILINTHVPRRWMETNNTLIASLAPEYPNVVLVDWRDTSEGHPEYFVSDGVHLTVPGQEAFILEIARIGQVAIAAPELPVPVKSSRAEIAAEDSPTLLRLPHPMASDVYWTKIAQCETGARWDNGGQFAGGLGIYVGSWKAWGGLAFAATPALATPAQQMTVANRISTQGWTRPNGAVQKPVGFSGWGCVQRIGQPALLQFTPESVLAQPFRWQQRGELVLELQALLGMHGDGAYGARTRAKHLELLKERGLPPELAGTAR